MHKHCVLLLAHRSPMQFKRTLGYFLETGSDVYIHVDVKAKIEDFHVPHENAHFSEARRDITWGGFSMVEATLDLIRTAIARDDYLTFSLVSGDCYGLRSPEVFLQALNSSTDIINYELVSPVSDTHRRISGVFLPDSGIGSLRGDRKFLYRQLDKETITNMNSIVKVFHGREDFLNNIKYYKGSQWWSLTRESINFVMSFISTNHLFVDHFRYSAIPDEAFFQTILMSAESPFMSKSRRLMFSKWDTSPAPYTFTSESELELLSSTTSLIARKFDDSSEAVVNGIRDQVW